ncbi:MAG: protein phosphatase 2C domain-containing protein [Azonexus sp.]|jgi:protein phosphatase|nr:protein phosphatase 2C domain-containing protein [Azonexus sp.]
MNLAAALAMTMRSDLGRRRERNEDAVFINVDSGLAILADGMGGSNAGEVASNMACALLAERFARFLPTCDEHNADGGSDPGFICEHVASEVAAVNRIIFDTAEGDSRYLGMGTTVVLAWFYDNQVAVAHVGDSRLYRLRDEHFELLTKDHSVLQEQIDSGMINPEEARFSDTRNLLTRALGGEAEVDVEVHIHDTRPGDLFLQCSDGLSEMVEDEEIKITLQTMGGNLDLAAEQLLRLANDYGGRDNISVILTRVQGDYAVPRGWWQHLWATMK